MLPQLSLNNHETGFMVTGAGSITLGNLLHCCFHVQTWSNTLLSDVHIVDYGE